MNISLQSTLDLPTVLLPPRQLVHPRLGFGSVHFLCPVHQGSAASQWYHEKSEDYPKYRKNYDSVFKFIVNGIIFNMKIFDDASFGII